MTTIILFLLILGLLVVVHEWGHFITARKSGMKVHEFGFGYPPRAFGFYRDPVTKKIIWIWGKGKSSLKKTVSGDEQQDEFPATLWSFNWLPLGGFVRIKGENGEEAGDNDSFQYHKAWKRIMVLVAGVTMNFILAVAILGFGFMIGLPTDLSQGVDANAIIVEEAGVLVQQVNADSPADSAGVQFGDVIKHIGDMDIKTVADVHTILENKVGETLTLRVQRGNELVDMTIIPEAVEGQSRAILGVAIAEAGVVRYPWYIALYKGLFAATFGLINIFVAFYFLIKNLILGHGLLFDIAGPVGIATVVGQSAKLGFNYVLNITAMLSLSLTAINILPIPALDGGRVLFIIIEKIIRKPVPMKYEQIAHTIGFVLLMLLVVVVTWRDVVRIL